MADLYTLLDLQERDTETDQLRHRRAHLPERARLDAVTAEMSAVEATGVTATAERDGLLARQAELETELNDVDKRRGEVDRRMRSGVVSAARDLQAMAGQIDTYKRRAGELEEMDLEVMEAIEPLDAQVGSLQDRWAALEKEAGELRTALVAAQAVVDAELDVVVAKRAEVAATIPADLLRTYERLRQRLGGVGAAALVGASCGGCHLTLSASELDQVRRAAPDQVVTCEQCGRILVH